MPPSKFEATQVLRLQVKRLSFSLFTLASSCLNAYFSAYAIIYFHADRLVFKCGHKWPVLTNTCQYHKKDLSDYQDVLKCTSSHVRPGVSLEL